MGKLLFKWIWANRSKLHSRLKYHQHWDHFISNVKHWKKENNITRKYLI